MENEFLPIDHYFAQKILPDGDEQASYFLACLLKSAREGHLYLEPNVENDPRLRAALSSLPPSLFERFLVKEENRIYLRRNWECEQQFLAHLKRLKAQSPHLMIPQAWLMEELDKTALNKEQKGAILKAALRTLTLISGGPGTGKTFTASILIRLFHAAGVKEIVIAAPTGKATSNLRHALGEFAEKCTLKTLHALLRKQRLTADLILVDEGSMVDAERMAALLSAVKEGARLVLLGDKDQLPPVESGNYFSDLAVQNEWVAELQTCLRTDLQEIVDLAARVRRGELISSHPLPELRALIPMILEKKAHVLTPLRKGIYGVDHLNQLLYQEHRKRGQTEVPIMVTVNDPHMELYNGDVGRLALNESCAYFSDGRKIQEHLLPRYEFAYVLSVHKSQGSEYENVMVLLPKGAETFGREMLYTALTRAKKQVAVYAEAGILEVLVKNSFKRRSGLMFYKS